MLLLAACETLPIASAPAPRVAEPPPPPPDTAPSFRAEGAANQTYAAGTAIEHLTLPEATGGNGTLAYSLVPSVPGLTFVPAARLLIGTPTEAGAHDMIYRVIDADENMAATDAATLPFTITVEGVVPVDEPPPLVVVPEGSTYVVGTQEHAITLDGYGYGLPCNGQPPLCQTFVGRNRRNVAVVTTGGDTELVVESIRPVGYVTAAATTQGEITIVGVKSTWNTDAGRHEPAIIEFTAENGGGKVRSWIEAEVNGAPEIVAVDSMTDGTIQDSYVIRLECPADGPCNPAARALFELTIADPEGEAIEISAGSSSERVAGNVYVGDGSISPQGQILVRPVNVGVTTITITAGSGADAPGAQQYMQTSFEVEVIP